MRLIHTFSLEIEHFAGDKRPKYAILSHMWGEEEASFQGWNARSAAALKQKGYQKIVSACELAREDGYTYIWVDTNCIDKSSSSELTEAINSMFEWYTLADICYAYLSDVDTYKPLTGTRDVRRSRWFRRGWTLQELLAPRRVNFYAADWSPLGTRTKLARHISAATGIDLKHLHADERREEATSSRTNNEWIGHRHRSLYKASVAERMGWLARRETTRIEDMAYCALGIFGINMPLIYGEGPRAFFRLQEEILRVSADQSLFCWSWGDSRDSRPGRGILSPRPQAFLEAGRYVPRRTKTRPRPYAMTNAGLSISFPLIHCWSSYIGVLDVLVTGGAQLVGIAITGEPTTTGRLTRLHYPDVPIHTCNRAISLATRAEAFVPLRSTDEWEAPPQPVPWLSLQKRTMYCRAGVLLSFDSNHRIFDITTIPPDRFSPADSIVEICPRDETTAEWNPAIFEGSASSATLKGATIVNFKLRKGATEAILFVISSSKTGNHAYPSWHSFRVTNLLGGGRMSDALHNQLQDHSLSANHLVKNLFPLDSGPKGTESRFYPKATPFLVQFASSGFLTTTGSMLTHVHISDPAYPVEQPGPQAVPP